MEREIGHQLQEMFMHRDKMRRIEKMGQKRLLIVEDESILSLDIQNRIRNLGYAVAGTANSGEEAIKKARETRPDLVLMDIMLRGKMDGVQAAEEIRSHVDIPVIYLTAYADEQTLTRAKLTEPFGYILKPFEERELHTTIQMAFYRHRLEKKLKQRERWLATTLRSIGDAVLATDSKGKIKFMNPMAEKLTGWRRKQAFGQDLKQVFNIMIGQPNSSEDPDRPPSPIKSQDDAESCQMLITKRGRKIPVHSSVAPIRDKRGQNDGVVLVLRDMSKQVQAQNKLSESEERYRHFFEEDLAGYFLAKSNGCIIACNPSFARFLGFANPEEAHEGSLANLFPDGEAFRTFLELLRRRKKLQYHQMELRHRDGKCIYVIGNVIGTFDGHGSLMTIKGYLFDITERMELEEQLRQTQKLDSIGILAGGVAHDFNNILGAVLGYASLLKMKISEDHPYFTYVDTIERSASRASELTSQLLAFARGGKYSVRPVNVNKIVNETLQIIRSTFDKLIEIKTQFREPLPTVEADSGQLQQVVMNLCVNARDAMRNGGTLVVETNVVQLQDDNLKPHVDAKPGSYVTLSVSDTGSGMDKKTLQRIFEPFFTTKENGKGTGLGLAMVYGVVKSHGGFIRVYSELKEGSIFTVYLPICDKEEPQFATHLEEPMGGKEVIMVVDDEESIREFSKELLESYGYRVLLAEDGIQSIETYKKHKHEVSLVILDLMMPRMGGREAFQYLKKLNPKVKALLSTGFSQNAKGQEITEAGIAGFIQKPYHGKDLLHMVRQTLDNGANGKAEGSFDQPALACMEEAAVK